MEIILKEDVDKLGHKDDLVNVKDGYARNYLIPNNLAVIATSSAKKMHEEIKRQRAHKEEKVKNQALEIAKKLENKTLTIGAKTSTTGKIFGSVNTIQIAEKLQTEGFEIDRKNINITDDQIKEVGKYKATIKLHKEVVVEIELDVVSE